MRLNMLIAMALVSVVGGLAYGQDRQQPPLAFERRVAEVWPDSAAPTARLLEFYLAESFGGTELSEPQLAEVRTILRTLRATLKRPRSNS